MLAYQKITVMKDEAKGKIVVENNNNTFEFFDCSMEEAAAFFKTMIEEEY